MNEINKNIWSTSFTNSQQSVLSTLNNDNINIDVKSSASLENISLVNENIAEVSKKNEIQEILVSHIAVIEESTV